MDHCIRFREFSDRSRSVLVSAEQEARRFNHQYLGTEHIFLCLVRETDCLAVKVLTNLGVRLVELKSEFERIMRQGERSTPSEIELTLRAKVAIEVAMDETHRLDHNYVGTHHLLVGLMREGVGVVAGMLEDQGMDLHKIRGESRQVHSPNGEQ